MKKSNFLILYLLTSVLSQFAQNQTSLTFTAKMHNDAWIALDSVKITNLNRSWTETIYYPDTILQMINSVRISEAEASIFQLYQNTPNPFKGSTSVSLQIRSKENVMLSLHDMNGKCHAIYNNVLEAGMHTFHISVADAQMYFFSVKTSQGYKSIKLLCTEGVDNNVISYECFQPKQSLKTQKAFTSQAFISGDSMVYEGYATFDGEVRNQTFTSVQNGNDEIISFELELPEYLIFSFMGNMDDSIYLLLDSVIIKDLSQGWTKIIYNPDTTLALFVNSTSSIHPVFQRGDAMECIGFATHNNKLKYQYVFINHAFNDTSIVFRMNSIDNEFVYIYYHDYKIYLRKFRNIKYVAIDTVANELRVMNILSKINHFANKVDTVNQFMFRLVLKDTCIQIFNETIDTIPDILFVSNELLYPRDSTIQWASNSLFVEIKEGYDLDSVLQAYNVPYKEKNKLSHSNIYYIVLSNGEDAIAYANFLYETGLFIASQPSFYKFIPH
ncbi:MAG: T9SS type A sorting domain-containing protein [Bacteroidales bacterium]